MIKLTKIHRLPFAESLALIGCTSYFVSMLIPRVLQVATVSATSDHPGSTKSLVLCLSVLLEKYRQSADKVPTKYRQKYRQKYFCRYFCRYFVGTLSALCRYFSKSTDRHKTNDLVEPGWSDVAETVATCSTRGISMLTKYEVHPISARDSANGKRWILVSFIILAELRPPFQARFPNFE